MKLTGVPGLLSGVLLPQLCQLFLFKGVREETTVLKRWQPRCPQILTPVATDTGTTLDGRGNLPCPCSGNLAADPVFFSDPTNALGSQAVSAFRSLGSSLILATAPLPLLPPSGEKTCAQAGSVRSRCWQQSHAEDHPPPGVLAPAVAPKRLRQGNFEWRPQSQEMGGGRPGEAAEELGKGALGGRRAAGSRRPHSARGLRAHTPGSHAPLTRTPPRARTNTHAQPRDRGPRPQARVRREPSPGVPRMGRLATSFLLAS